MGTFAQVEARKPPGMIVVPVSAFADTWEERPDEEVAMGLRLVGDADLEDARVEAFRRACRLVPDHNKSEEKTTLWIASFQDALVRWIIGRGTCDVNDVSKAWEGWAAAPVDMVPEALTDKGAQLIFDAWERMRIEVDIGVAEATDADIELLTQLAPRLALLTPAAAARCRRLMRFVLEELEEVGPAEASAAQEQATVVAADCRIEANDDEG